MAKVPKLYLASGLRATRLELRFRAQGLGFGFTGLLGGPG